MRNTPLLKGKVALITGAAQGIGKITARMLAGEGASVGVTDINNKVYDTLEFVKNFNHPVAACIFDVSDPIQVKEGVAKISAELGPIDILVNNAAIVANIARCSKMSHEAWQREIMVNLGGAFNMIKEVVESMAERGWGRIINVSSLAATVGLQRQSGYAASKAGLLGLTKTITLEYAAKGITCNAILPGLIETETVCNMPEEIKKGAVAIIPASRMGKTEEVGHLITFLSSDQASYINGEEIHIDGGMRLNIISLGNRKEMAIRSRAQH